MSEKLICIECYGIIQHSESVMCEGCLADLELESSDCQHSLEALRKENEDLKAELSAYKEGIKPEKARDGGDFILLFDTFGDGPRAIIGGYDKRYPNEPWGNENEYYPEGNLIKIIPFDPFPHQQKEES